MIFLALARILYTCLLFIETVVSIRFVFKLIGANESNVIVRTVYEVSNIFVDPFVGIVTGEWEIGRFYIDVDALVSLVLFMIIAFVVIEIIRAFTPRSV